MTKGVGKTHSEAGDGPAGYPVPLFAGFIRSQVLARTGGAPAPRESTRGWPLIRKLDQTIGAHSYGQCEGSRRRGTRTQPREGAVESPALPQ